MCGQSRHMHRKACTARLGFKGWKMRWPPSRGSTTFQPAYHAAQVDVSQEWNTAFGTQSFVVQPWQQNIGAVSINIGTNPQFYSSSIWPEMAVVGSEVWCQATNTNQTTDQGKARTPSYIRD